MTLGTGYISKEEAEELLESLVELEAVELQILNEKEGQKKGLVRFPYMMNDAVEYYLELQNCTVRGEWDADDSVEDFSFVKSDSSEGLILRQFSGNTITIWYERIFRVAECYQYHRIGHKWREAAGEENLRRIVNLLCVMHDKVHYLGGMFCNEAEKELYELAEFGPLRYYSPINESILEWYPETEAGAQAMIRLALKAGDEAYRKLAEKYLEEIRTGKHLNKRISSLAKELIRKEHYGIYQTLCEEIEKASIQWKVRNYGQKRNQEIAAYRERMEEKYHTLGYEGTYPVMEKEISKGFGKETSVVEFVEEHPFTVLEYEDYEFRIFSMMRNESKPFSIRMEIEK